MLWGKVVMNVFVYLRVCSLVGLHFVIAKGGDVDQFWDEHESPRRWANLLGGINFEDGANETFSKEVTLEPNHTEGVGSNVTSPLYNGDLIQQTADGYNGSLSSGHRSRMLNTTGMPIDMFFRWWSEVRPFANEMATIPKFPWTVAVQMRRGQVNSHLCSGNILTKLYVLSTCRCLSNPTGSAVIPLTPKDPSYINIVAGISMLDIPLKEQLFYGQIRNAASVNIHPQCTLSHKYDYGVIELEYYLYYTKRIWPIPNLFDAFRGQTSSKGHDSFQPMREHEICTGAGWLAEKIFGDDDSKGKQKVNYFKILEQDICFGTALQDGNQLVCTKAVSGDPWKSISGYSGDIGSGLVCHKRVTAILSHHSGGLTVFASLRPALGFLWQYYQEDNEIYVMSSCHLPVASLMLVIFVISVPPMGIPV